MTLMEIIDATHNLTLQGKNKEQIMRILDGRELLPRMFASEKAKDLARDSGLELKLGGGTGRNNTYTIADVRSILEKTTSITEDA